MAQFVDKQLLRPLLPKCDFYSVKDSKVFRDRIVELTMEEGDVCASFDVKSLFTSIPVDETINVICNYLYHNGDPLPKLYETELSEENCRELLSTLVKNVRFVFNKQVFEQTDGLAMGSPLSVAFSQIFMASLERKLFQGFESESLKYYCRYVDDTFIVGEKKVIEQFFDRCNGLHSAIDFTKEDEACNFLDVQLHFENGDITTSIFRKPSFTGLYDIFRTTSI